MNEAAREKLREIIEKNGDAILHEPDRCEALLKDHCPAFRREISALVGAMAERVPLEIKSSWQTAMTPEAMRTRLVQRLEENRGLAPDVADWAVDSWSYALGVSLGRKSSEVAELAATGQADSGPNAPIEALAVRPPADIERKSDPKAELARERRTERMLMLPLPILNRQQKLGAGGASLLAIALLAYLFWPKRPPVPPVPDCKVNNSAPGCSQPPPPPPVPAPSTVTVPSGTQLTIRINQGVSSDTATQGDLVTGTLVLPVEIDGNVVLPEGAAATLKLTRVNSAKVGAIPLVELGLAQITVDGKDYPVASSSYKRQGQSVKVSNKKIVAGGGIGAAIGGALRKGKGAVAGLVTGASSTYAMQKASHLPAEIGAETKINFTLVGSLTLGAPQTAAK
jgi:hypothetical protein